MRLRIEVPLSLCALLLVPCGVRAGPLSTEHELSPAVSNENPVPGGGSDRTSGEGEQEDTSSHDAMDAHVWRTWREMALGLSALSLGYWLGMDRRVADFKNYSLEYRLRADSWRLDNNHLSVNFALHPLGGAVAYTWARAYHHGPWASAAYGLLAQSIWEFALEFKTEGSINDVIVTPTAGIPIGEFLHKLGLYLDTAASPGTATQIAQWSFGTAVQVDRWLDGRDHRVPSRRDSLGFTREIWHGFTLGGGTQFVRRDDGSEHALYRTGFAGRLVSIPGYLAPGHFSRTFWRADVSSAEVGFEASRYGIGATAAADVLLFGHHAQSIDGTARKVVRGHGVTSGASLAFSYLESKANGLSEKYGALHAPGPAVDLHLIEPTFELDLSARGSFDCVGISVLDAFDDWKLEHPGVRSKGILRTMNYLYALGGSSRVAGRLRIGPFILDGQLLYGKYRSVDGLNKYQEKVEADIPGGTELLWYRAAARVQPPGSPVSFGLSAERRRWATWLDDLHRRASWTSAGLDVRSEF